MFTAIKLNLRNAMVLAKSLMKLTDENFRAMLAIIDLLSDNRYLLFGVGEDVEATSAEVVLTGNALTVDAASLTPGTVTYATARYSYDMLLKDVILDGEKVSFEVIKTYADGTTKTFTSSQLPLKSNNFKLVVTIQPGGSLKRSALLQAIIME